MIGAMSKRGQNTTSNDGSPTAKARPVNLVMHSPCNEDFSSPSWGSLVNPWKGWTSTRELDARRPQIGSRLFPSESIREGSSSHQETGAEGSIPNKK